MPPSPRRSAARAGHELHAGQHHRLAHRLFAVGEGWKRSLYFAVGEGWKRSLYFAVRYADALL
jgi:hypothetical protein